VIDSSRKYFSWPSLGRIYKESEMYLKIQLVSVPEIENGLRGDLVPRHHKFIVASPSQKQKKKTYLKISWEGKTCD
jgi:hypothetical protein